MQIRPIQIRSTPMRLLLSMMLLLTALMSHAQDVTLLPDFPANLTGEFTTQSDSGAMLDRHNGTHVLILEDAAAITQWMIDAPEDYTQFGGDIETTIFTRGWRAQPELTGYGILELDDVTLGLALRTPLLNPETGTLTYTVVVEDVLEPAGMTPADLLLNRRFGNATLRVVIDPDFMQILQDGISTATENERECACPPGTPGLLCEICQSGL